MQTFGDKNLDKTFYVIWRKDKRAGFFSNVFHVFGHIWLAERLGMIPVVDMQHFSTPYKEAVPVNDTENVWEYYFEQPTGFSLTDAYASRYVFFCNGECPFDIYYNIEEGKKKLRKNIYIPKSLSHLMLICIGATTLLVKKF